jgi:hypothetical protein
MEKIRHHPAGSTFGILLMARFISDMDVNGSFLIMRRTMVSSFALSEPDDIAVSDSRVFDDVVSEGGGPVSITEMLATWGLFFLPPPARKNRGGNLTAPHQWREIL